MNYISSVKNMIPLGIHFRLVSNGCVMYVTCMDLAFIHVPLMSHEY